MKAFRDQYDPHGGRASAAARCSTARTAEYGGEMLYINKSAPHALLGDGIFPRRRPCENTGTTIRRRFTRTATARYTTARMRPNTTATRTRMRSRTSSAGSTIGRPGPAPANASARGGVNIIFSDSNTHHRGAENYRRSGEVDAMRIPKDGYFADQVMWDGWVDLAKAADAYHRPLELRRRDHERTSMSYPTPKRSSSSSTVFQRVLASRASRFLFTFKNVEWKPGHAHSGCVRCIRKKMSQRCKNNRRRTFRHPAHAAHGTRRPKG